MLGSGITILLFVVGALFIGALLKTILHDSKLPYTVVLLIVGLGIASLDRTGLLGDGMMHNMFQQVAGIDPHLILFLFLPTLIFESAYSMEPHLFFRIAPQIALLAVLGLIISMVLSALAVSWLLSWGVGAAMLFGALISATDPVAVVALLKEKSSRKRLETLIEGESLLNDGTAIVFFSIFYGFVIGQATEVEPLGIAGQFIWVVSAGLLIGVAVGWSVLWLIGKLFNQPLIEITLSIVAAYVTFIAAEALHVSGVVALVALALMFSTQGRTKISPEISHFLHQFWEMMTYIANTLIFAIVGIVIALNIKLDSPELWLMLGMLYVVLTLIRSFSVWSLMPLLKRIGVGITRQKATVLVWGGLRGAVSLALALAIAQDEAVPEVLREQVLFLTAGIVVLTIVINGSTMEWLLGLLKLDKLPPAKQASVLKAQQNICKKQDVFIRHFLNNPFFNQVDAEKMQHMNHARIEGASSSTQIMQEDINIAFMRRLLEIERSDYWRQFEQGYIGRQAAFKLASSVEQALDNNPVIAPRDALESSLSIPTPPAWMERLPVMGKSMQDWLFSHLSLNYDIARGFVEAQEVMRMHIEQLQPNAETGRAVDAMIDQNCAQAFAFTRHISEQYPQLISSLQLLSAQRVMLNHERSLIWKLHHEGVLEDAEAQHLIDHIENQMRQTREKNK